MLMNLLFLIFAVVIVLIFMRQRLYATILVIVNLLLCWGMFVYHIDEVTRIVL